MSKDNSKPKHPENISASVSMEEEYMRVSVKYFDGSLRTYVCETIAEVEDELGVHPEVIHRRLNENAGGFSVEFDAHDHHDYDENRDSGAFVERLLDRLGITECDDAQ